MESIGSRDPRAHVANVRGEFQKLIQHLRENIDKIDDSKGQALFETAAEVLTGLSTPSNITSRRTSGPGSSPKMPA
jgi:hypothetical protein